jgi:endogenous inhibitor of DNA gyrase (YacG/DUF329 family)
MKELTTALAVGKGNVNRFEAVTCAACGRRVARASRQQRYCSDRCRDFAYRENKARTAIKNPAEYQDSGQPTQPFFFPKKNNGLQGRKSGSSTPLNVLGGYRWPNAGGVERDLLRKIIRAEIGADRAP